jgi:hypothetical protein
MLLKTYDEWKKEGFHVIKGQKASARNAKGEAVFDTSQVKKYMYSSSVDEDYDRDIDRDLGDYYFHDRDWY